MNYIDRTAITTARLKGLEQDLHLSVDLQYNVVLSILYVTYCPMQIPSNMMLNWITKPSLYIGACVVLWGLISTMTGVTQSYGGILAVRFCIGIPEVTTNSFDASITDLDYARVHFILALSTYSHGGTPERSSLSDQLFFTAVL
ncbi:hypothetical protein BT96DRAFT_1027707 [Gymnopus androsaceus JB14]|uniref:Major facilitator superfamily (MFS) profile domain-containing protein n=1 Tax=Gymnopus androsaceus JB14 TaxID=1447944 RepID=A0A6A4G9X7_9AGAR|nr:hypothetical protein BT96DRAFT_1027707 [Gymnopus androsaceus JB14]